MEPLHIIHPLFEAHILPQGAQIIAFTPRGGAPFLWSASLETFVAGKPFRGGIPICWPWFGRVRMPAHGFARTMVWTLVERIETPLEVRLVWQLSDDETTRAVWDYPFTLRLEMVLSQRLALTLYVDTLVATTAALHTYVAVEDVRSATITGLGSDYYDALQGNTFCSDAPTTLVIEGEIDRIYPHAHSTTQLQTPQRTLHIAHQEASDVVVWNPWKKLDDMKQGEQMHMLCIESARILTPLQNTDSLGVVMECETRNEP